MVLCPICGKEYSLGTTICHKCKGSSTFHGVICSEKPKRRPWNCNDKRKKTKSELEIKEIFKHIHSYLNTLKSYLS